MFRAELLGFAMIAMLVACSGDQGLNFSRCVGISDNFLALVDPVNTCPRSEAELVELLGSADIRYVKAEADGYHLSLIVSHVEPYAPAESEIHFVYVIYGELYKSRRRKENYIALLDDQLQLLAVLPKYSYY